MAEPISLCVMKTITDDGSPIQWSDDPPYRGASAFQDDGGTPMWRARHAQTVPTKKYGKWRWFFAWVSLAFLPVFILLWGFLALVAWALFRGVFLSVFGV